MKWYANIRTAAKPPSYLVERVSDLKHACDVAKTSPREANLVVSRVISQLSMHHDDAFVAPLKDAIGIMLDSPARARSAIEKIMAAMIAEREMSETESDEKPWKTRT